MTHRHPSSPRILAVRHLGICLGPTSDRHVTILYSAPPANVMLTSSKITRQNKKCSYWPNFVIFACFFEELRSAPYMQFTFSAAANLPKSFPRHCRLYIRCNYALRSLHDQVITQSSACLFSSALHFV